MNCNEKEESLWRCNALSLFTDWLNYAVRSSGDVVLYVRIFMINNENRITKIAWRYWRRPREFLTNCVRVQIWTRGEAGVICPGSYHIVTHIMYVPDYTASQQWTPLWELQSSYSKVSTFHFKISNLIREFSSFVRHINFHVAKAIFFVWYYYRPDKEESIN